MSKNHQRIIFVLFDLMNEFFRKFFIINWLFFGYFDHVATSWVHFSIIKIHWSSFRESRSNTHYPKIRVYNDHTVTAQSIADQELLEIAFRDTHFTKITINMKTNNCHYFFLMFQSLPKYSSIDNSEIFLFTKVGKFSER